MSKRLSSTGTAIIAGLAIVVIVGGLVITAALSPRSSGLFISSDQSATVPATEIAATDAESVDVRSQDAETSLSYPIIRGYSSDQSTFTEKSSDGDRNGKTESPKRSGSDIDGVEIAAITEAEIDETKKDEKVKGESEKYEVLIQQEAFWLDRLTYPTGRFNPAWVRAAAAQDARLERTLPFGTDLARSGTSLLDTEAFTPLGPAPERMTGCSGCYDYGTTQGRVNAIVVDPTTTTNGSIVAYIGTIGGGVWKTTTCCTASTSWDLVTDDPLISTTGIDTLAMDPNDHNTIYAGTGDLNFGSFSMGSQGVLKTTDGGTSWSVLGSNVFGAAYVQPAGQFPQYDAVGKVRVDPNDSSRVVAGTKKGIFMSYDGGVNWTGPCSTNNHTTQRQDTTGLELSDMGGGVTRVLVAVGTRGFATPVQYDLGAQGANGLYRGTVPTSGCPGDFTLITRNDNGFVFGNNVSGSPYATGAAMNAGSGVPYVNATTGNQLSRMDIAVAPSNPNYIYVQVGSIAGNSASGCGGGSGCQLGMWSSIDNGNTWSFMTGSAGGSLRACSTGGITGTGSGSAGGGDYAQNWYDQGLAVDPNNPDRVFVDTFDTWLATRTGTSLYNITCGYSGTALANHNVHVDHHALAFVPGSSSMLLAGNDGGVFATLNANAAMEATFRPTWVNMYTGLNTIEFYAGDISGNFANDPTPHAVGGAQDNGPSSVKFAGSPTGPVQWQMGLGGDGFSGQIDPMGTGPTQAVGAITVSGVGVIGQQFVIDGQTFTWAATRTVAGTVAIGTSSTTAATAIRTAVNADLAGVVAAGGTGSNVTATSVVQGAGGNSIPFSNINSANLTMNGLGFLGGTTQGGLPGSLRIWQGNNSGGLSRCISNCTNSGATYTSSRGSWTGDQQSFVLPVNLFHGGIPGGDDCGPAGVTSGCGRMIAGTTRVWETISGTAASVPTSAWYITNNPAGSTAGPNLTKGTLSNRSYINQVKYSPKYYSVAIVGTNDGNVQIGFNLGTGIANQANWVNVTGDNAVLPNRPILGIALDPSVPAANVPVGYAAVGGFNANTPSTPGHVFQVSCGVDCGSFNWLNKSGNLPDIPVDSIINNPNYPQMVFAGTDFGLYFTNDITAASPVWHRFQNGLPAVMIWDMQIDRGSTTLSLWTRGRGAYAWPLPMAGLPTPTPTPACADVDTPVLTSKTNSEITIPVNTADLTGRGILSADFTFNYDPAVLSPLPADISVTSGPVSPSAQITINKSVSGTVTVSVFHSTEFSTAGPLVYLHMKVIGPIGSSTGLTLSNFRFNGSLACSNVTSGTLSVVSGSVTGKVTFENAPYPGPPPPTVLPVPGTQIEAVGGTTFSSIANGTGDYSLSGFGLGSYTVTPSRPNESFMTTNGIFSDDPSLVAQHVVQLITLSPAQQRAADVSGIHSLSSYDAALIAQWIVGIPNPVNRTGRWIFTPESTSPDTLVDSTQNYLGLLMGDVNGSWSPFMMRYTIGQSDSLFEDLSVTKSIKASVPKFRVTRGEQIVVPLKVENLQGREVTSYQFDIEYDATVLNPETIAADLAGTVGEGFSLAANSPAPGLLKVAVFGAIPVSSDGVFANLRFRVTGAGNTTTALTISGFRLNNGVLRVVTTNGSVSVTSDDTSAISGRLLTTSGEAVQGVRITAISTSGETMTTDSDSNGSFEFWGVTVGETYTISVRSGALRFAPRVISAVGNNTKVEIIAEQ